MCVWFFSESCFLCVHGALYFFLLCACCVILFQLCVCAMSVCGDGVSFCMLLVFMWYEEGMEISDTLSLLAQMKKKTEQLLLRRNLISIPALPNTRTGRLQLRWKHVPFPRRHFTHLRTHDCYYGGIQFYPRIV